MSRPAHLSNAALPESGGQAARSAAQRQMSSYVMVHPLSLRILALRDTLPSYASLPLVRIPESLLEPHYSLLRLVIRIAE